MAVELEDEEFEELVRRALERIPQQFLGFMENCVIAIQEESPPGQVLLGRYEGVPVTNRAVYSGAVPDVITIYQKPILRVCETLEQVEQQVYITVVHEIGHYFGLDDEQLHELNWG